MTGLALLLAGAAFAQAPLPAPAASLLTAVEAGDLAAARATLAPDAVIMDESSGRPVASSIEALAAHLRGCERSDTWTDVDAEDPSRAAVTISWTCPGRAATQAFVWTFGAGVVHIQFGMPAQEPGQ